MAKAKKTMKTKSMAKTKTKSVKKSATKTKPAAKAKMKAKPANKTATKPLAKLNSAKAKLVVKAKLGGAAKKTAPGKTAAQVPAKMNSASPAPKKKSTADFAQVFSPLDNRVVVEKTELATRTPGGLYIPDLAEQSGSSEGKVVAVGPGHRTKKGKMKLLDVKVGDRVMFNQFAGSEITLDNDTYLIVREEEIIAVVNN